MGRLRVVRKAAAGTGPRRERHLCREVVHTLESGEQIKRGCGRWGLVGAEVGWRCLYCGNYIYQSRPSLRALWLHFRLGREYWRAGVKSHRDHINGVPVQPPADPLPRFLRADLEEPRPPAWFPYFIWYEDDQFQRYLETSRHGRKQRNAP